MTAPRHDYAGADATTRAAFVASSGPPVPLDERAILERVPGCSETAAFNVECIRRKASARLVAAWLAGRMSTTKLLGIIHKETAHERQLALARELPEVRRFLDGEC